MKNIKENQLKKCIFIGLDEFTSLVENLTDGLQTVEYEDGIYMTPTQKAEDTNTWWNEDILETLSKYFDVEVTSFHSDSCDYVGVWICYKCKEELDIKLKRKAEILDKIMDMLGNYEINGVDIFDSDEELEKFLICELGLNDEEIRQLGFELYV